MSNKNIEDIVCFLSTASRTTNEYGEYEATNYVNPQLDSWVEAKKMYFNLLLKKYTWADFKSIIGKLGDSLSDLFGVNYKTSKGRTPALREYIVRKSSGFSLKKRKPM